MLMQISNIHRWDLDYSEAVNLQKELADSVCLTFKQNEPRFIAGVDVSCNLHSPALFAAAVVWDLLEKRIVETASARMATLMPYIPGLLSFREAPVICEALSCLRHPVDALLVDGHGIAHPRRLGIASHIGLLVDIPVIGVAKKKFVGKYDMPAAEKFAVTDLIHNGERIGIVLRSRAKVKPVFVSPGNNIDFTSSIHIVKSCITQYKLPEPTRLAHIESNRLRKMG